jgi:rhodanese-related sulfurtransferase
MMPRIPEVEVTQIPLDAENPPYLLDVRDDDEWEAGHIEGAQHIPMMQVPARLGEIARSERVLVICRSGSRSAHVVGLLQNQGVDAWNVSGGMQVWSRLGRPMVGSSGSPAHVM